MCRRCAKRSVGIHVDIPDMRRRWKYGNNFDVDTYYRGPRGYIDEDNKEMDFSLMYLYHAPNSNTRTTWTFGNVKAGRDGIGVHISATMLDENAARGPFDFGRKIGHAEAGAKLWEPGVGLDVGVKAKASIAEAQLGPVHTSIGVGISSNVKAGKEGVGLKWLGTGLEVGRKTELSISGTSFGVTLW